MISFVALALLFTFVSANTETSVLRIVNSGSTNTAGYVIEVRRDGLVRWTVGPRHQPIFTTTPSTSTTRNNLQLQLSLERTNSIFEAIQRASPLNQYAPVFCIKSVSFGTTLHVSYNGQESPDLNCPVKDEPLVILSKYIHELIADLHINTLG